MNITYKFVVILLLHCISRGKEFHESNFELEKTLPIS